MPVPSPTPRVRAADTRRLRDLLRIIVAMRDPARGLLPGEDELMLGFGVARSVVRSALALLSAERLLRPGPAAHRIVAAPGYPWTHDVTADPARPVRPLGRAGVTAPEVLARWLDVEVGSPVLRTECLAELAGGIPVLETHYVGTAAAAELLAEPETAPFGRLLDDAGLHPGAVAARSGPVPADPDAARLLGVAPGSELLGIERTVTGPDGRVLAVGVLRTRPGACPPPVAPVPQARAVPAGGSVPSRP